MLHFQIINQFYQKKVRNILIHQYFYFLGDSKCQVKCEYHNDNDQSEILATKITQEFPITSEIINFEEYLVKFINIDINSGSIYLYLIINGEQYKQNSNSLFHILFLNKIGIKINPFELSLPMNDIIFKITIKTMNKEQDHSLALEKENLPKKETIDRPLSFAERIKMFSGGYNSLKNKNAIKVSTRPLTIRPNIDQLSNKKDTNSTQNNLENNKLEKNNEKNDFNQKNNEKIEKQKVNENNIGKEIKKENKDITKEENEDIPREEKEVTKEENKDIPKELTKEENKEIPKEEKELTKEENKDTSDEINKDDNDNVIKEEKKDVHEQINENKDTQINPEINEKEKENQEILNENKEKESEENIKAKEEKIKKESPQKLDVKKEDIQTSPKTINKDEYEEDKFRTEKAKTIVEPNRNKIDKKENKIDNQKDEKEERSLTVLKKNSVPQVKTLKLDGDQVENGQEEKENFLEGIAYDKYLSKLKSENKKEHESGRESFCEGFFIASFPQKEGQVIEGSQAFPSPCGHKECSILPSMKPEIIARYPLEDTKTLELNNLAATICFPTGIKVCYNEKNPTMINDYVTPITNQKGERYYMMTYHFYHKVMNDFYSKIYEMHPLKHHLMKFGDNYLNMSEEEMDERVTNKIQEELEKAQELGFRDYVYIPYCICLISKYPYITEMKKCLQSIYTMFINHLAEKRPDLNNLIMHLIHSIPIPEKNTKVRFFIPFCNKGIDLICPKVQDISVMNTNISNLLKYFSIDNLVIIFRLMLAEKKILFIDNDYSRLSQVTDSFISLLYPFQWVHTYIPIMSDQMLKYLETFLPFLNGINSSLMPLVTEVFENNEVGDSEEVFIVYIYMNKFRLGSSLTSNKKKKYKYLQENVPALPSAMEKELKFKLKKIKDELDYMLKNQKNKKLDLSDLDFRTRNVFINMFVQMFHDYYKYMTFLSDDVVFNKTLFLEKITNNNDKHFYDEFIDTQLFQQFTQNIVKDELKYFKTMAMKYEPNKKESIKRSLRTNFNKDKLYVIKPDYLQINEENSNMIETIINSKYEMNQQVDEDGIIKSSNRILSQIDKINDDLYKNENCYIYTLPETLMAKNENDKKEEDEPDESAMGESNIYKILKKLNLKANKSFTKRGFGISEKEKDNIKETIKDFSVKIFKSEEIEGEINQKKDLQNALNNYFGRDFFVSMLTKNVTNIILLKEKSFQLLGTLIYNSLLYILNIDESNKILEQMVILIKSTKFFGKEKKGAITTLWDEYKPKIQGYSKVYQANLWNKWYELETKKEKEKESEEELNNLKKEKIILDLCNIMIELELPKSFIKNICFGLSEKEFGKSSEQCNTTQNLIVQAIIKAKYISKAH